MNTKTTLPITEARSKIFELTREVQKPGVHYTFTENGRPTAVLLSAEEYESLIETLEVMKDFPDLDKDVEQARREYAEGKWVEYSTLEQAFARQKFQVADKSKKTYGVSRSAPAKRGKRSRKNPR